MSTHECTEIVSALRCLQTLERELSRDLRHFDAGIVASSIRLIMQEVSPERLSSVVEGLQHSSAGNSRNPTHNSDAFLFGAHH